MGAGASASAWNESLSEQDLLTKKAELLEYLETVYSGKKGELGAEELLTTLEQEYKSQKMALTSGPGGDQAGEMEPPGSLSPETYARIVSLATESIVQREGTTFLVCVDGSENSFEAIQTAVCLRKGGDRLKCIHINDPQKKDLPRQLQPEAIKEAAAIQTVSAVPQDRYDFSILTKYGQLTTKDMLVNHVNAIAFQDTKSASAHPKIVVSGFIGRKGPKEDPCVMGQTADATCRGVLFPSMIIKTPPKEAGQPRHFAVAVDGRVRSHRAYLLTLGIMKPQDKVTCVYVEGAGTAAPQQSADRVRGFYERDFQERGLVCATVVVLDGGGGAHEPLLAWLRAAAPDFAAVAARPTQAFVSVSDQVVRNCRCNVIVCKSKSGDTSTDDSVVGA